MLWNLQLSSNPQCTELRTPVHTFSRQELLLAIVVLVKVNLTTP